MGQGDRRGRVAYSVAVGRVGLGLAGPCLLLYHLQRLCTL